MVTLLNRWLFILLIPAGLYLMEKTHGGKSLFADKDDLSPHPIHVSVTEINHNAIDKTLEISVRIFTDDFEKVLAKNYKTRVDLINPDRKAMDKLVSDYIKTHLSARADGKPVNFVYLGFEKEDEVINSYLQVDDIATVNKIELVDRLMHDLFTDQTNLIHVIAGGKRKSVKLDYPDTKTEVNF